MNLFERAMLLGLLAIASTTSRAETLQDAWAAAIDAHQRIAAAEEQRNAARSSLDGARAERYPSLDVESAFMQLDRAPRFTFGESFVSPPLFSSDNVATATARVSLPVYTGGAVTNGIESARSLAAASESQLDVVIQDVKLGTAERYVGVLRAASALDVAGSSVTALASHTVDAKNRFEMGAVPRNDFLAASVALANARQAELRATNRLDLSRSAYNRFLGRALDAEVSLDPQLSLDALLPAGATVTGLVETARGNRRELAGLDARAASLRARSETSRADARPQLALTGGYMLLENDVLDEERFWTVGLALRWNLFDSGRTRSRAAAFEREARAVMHERADLESLIALEVRQAWFDREEAESRRDVAGVAVDQAEENLRVVRDRHRAGAGTSTEVLDAEALRTASLANRDSARYDAAMAKLRLARAAGLL